MPLLTVSVVYGTVFTRYEYVQGGLKTDTQFNFWDNFRNSAPILTIISLL